MPGNDSTENPRVMWDSMHMIGEVHQRFMDLHKKNWDWSSFYNGWLEGRMSMFGEMRKNGTYPLTDADIAELIDYADAEDGPACIRSICEKIKARGRS